MSRWNGKRGALALAAGLALVTGCRSRVENRDPSSEAFPAVEGESLDGEAVALPPRGEIAVLLVGYEQDAQFDADRWLFGLLQAETPARVVEVPTLVGRMPRLFAGKIDAGMRSGIPSEDWSSVVTLYGEDAERVRAFTGNEGGRNMRVLLVDGDGRVRWFHDRGFSAGKLLELDRAARALESGG